MSTRLTREARWRRIRIFVATVGLAAIMMAVAFFGRGPAPASASGVAAISAGGGHTCAVTSAGGLKCWGANFSGQLGDGTTTQRTTPADVSGLGSGVAAISAGGAHTCALTTAGGVRCWGANFFGGLGDGQACGLSSCTSPVNVSGLGSGVAAISANGNTCALTTAGGVKCWGRNYDGELGDGQACGSYCTTPVDVSGLASGVAAIAVGSNHACALTAAGGVKCWGNNSAGQLGDGQACGAVCTTPVDVSGLGSAVAAVAAGNVYTCAMTTAGGVKCWGYNAFGQLGDGRACGSFTCTTAVGVTGLGSGVAAVSAGDAHTCAVTTAGGVKCWGYNGHGQLGDGTSTGPQLCSGVACSTTPVDVSGLASGVAAVAAGGAYTCALTTAGGAKCWGNNFSGQLGDGTTTQRTTPVDVSGLGPKPTPTATATSTSTATATSTSTPTPRPVLGGVATYPDLPSGQHMGLVNGVIAALAVSAVTLGGAAWYTRRRRFE